MFVLAFVQSAAPESFPSKSCERPSFPEKRHPTITETHFLRLKLFPVMYIYTHKYATIILLDLSLRNHCAWILELLDVNYKRVGLYALFETHPSNLLSMKP